MKTLLFFCGMFLMQGCHFGKGEILPIDTMKVVMWEVMQVDEFSGYYIAKDSSKNVVIESNKLYNKVFALHQVSGEQFFKSFTWYRNNVAEYKRLIDSVGAYGDRKREERFAQPVPNAGKKSTS